MVDGSSGDQAASGRRAGHPAKGNQWRAQKEDEWLWWVRVVGAQGCRVNCAVLLRTDFPATVTPGLASLVARHKRETRAGAVASAAVSCCRELVHRAL